MQHLGEDRFGEACGTNRRPLLAGAALLALYLLACNPEVEPPTEAAAHPKELPSPVATTSVVEPAFVGSDTCAGCHPEEAEAWRGSHHDLAMQAANSETALAPFEGEGHRSSSGSQARFSKDAEGSLQVHLETPGQELATHRVAYLFGASPLQQLLIDRGEGRLAALHLAWDARAKEVGGQRWFSLHGEEEFPAGDPLHWTGMAASWNVQCADCHSTGLDTGYDATTRRYQPRWSEMDVACEACHGPGAQHVDQLKEGRPLADSGLVARPVERRWAWRGEDAIATRQPAPSTEPSEEQEVCAPCHSRRSRIARSQPGAAFLDSYLPALLDPGLYHPDGQIREEVYVWGSFLQSKMHRAGVVCSDCHDPHRLEIGDPDAACAGCHQPDVFAARSHHQHPDGSAGTSCVACHMPATTYMAIDDRRDHSLRVPRPDLAVRFGTPDACTKCHQSEGDGWAAEQAKAFWGPPTEHWLHQPDLAERALDPGHAPIVRATALNGLAARSDKPAFEALLQGARSNQALERLGAARGATHLPPEPRWGVVGTLLSDPVRAVRWEAAQTLAGHGANAPGPNLLRALTAAAAEVREGLKLTLDRPSSHVQLGDLDRALGNPQAAEHSYRQALALAPWYVPASVNLADLFRLTGRDEQSQEVLERALAAVGSESVESAAIHQSLGLLLIRQGRHEDALIEFKLLTELQPDDPRATMLYQLTQEAIANTAEGSPTP